MRRLSDTVARLAAIRGLKSVPRAASRLAPLRDFGTNPGNLQAWCHVPDWLDSGAALVVVLHGCTQDAAGYDEGSGWSTLADELGFAVLYPEQSRTNNYNLCFNWYEPGDSSRGGGEPLSIVQMIEHMVEAYQLDRSRVFVTGLSAGGAMTSVMLATYPEVFAGGAIIAGLAYGCAASVQEALQLMRHPDRADGAALASAVLAASPGTDRRPRISIWHGAADHVVLPANADAILAQWQAIHGLLGAPDRSSKIAGHVHREWLDEHGTVMVEDYRIAGMGHGTPLETQGPGACGMAGPHMLEAGISSTRHIAIFWRLADTRKDAASAVAAKPGSSEGHTRGAGRNAERAKPVDEPRATASGVGKVIEDALRAAGLMP